MWLELFESDLGCTYFTDVMSSKKAGTEQTGRWSKKSQRNEQTVAKGRQRALQRN